MKTSPSSNGHTERDKRIAAVHRWMKKHCASDGVDALLTRPFDAAAMAMLILADEGANVGEAIKTLQEWTRTYADIVQRIEGVCRVAMNARKRGELKPHATSPAKRANETRKAVAR
jgi:hypothetical protein